jgi:hypothetical protein
MSTFFTGEEIPENGVYWIYHARHRLVRSLTLMVLCITVDKRPLPGTVILQREKVVSPPAGLLCRAPNFPRPSAPGLGVTFQEVVHSSKTREADCDEQSTQIWRPEWYKAYD